MNQPNYPFHYEVKFRLLAYQDNNTINIQSHAENYKAQNPLEARIEAFKDFQEYLSFKNSNNLLQEIDGNYRIVKPSPEKFGIDTDYFEKYKSINEEVAVYLVIDNKQLAKDIQKMDYDKSNNLMAKLEEFSESLGVYNQTEFLIHKVGTRMNETEEQEMIVNLEFTELKLYKHCNIDTTDYEMVVNHYGLDFCESGEDEDQCEWTILETPHVWSSKDRYDIEFATNVDSQTETENPSIFNWKEIIELGEGHQVEFKPALRYHFKHRKATNSIRKIIAKSICAFLNSQGGILFIGVTDKGSIQGLEKSDYLLFEDNVHDKFKNEFDNLINHFLSLSIKPFVNLKIEKIQGKDIGVVEVQKSNRPVFLKSCDNLEIQKEFYMRAEASSRQITDVEEIIQYVFNNWKND